MNIESPLGHLAVAALAAASLPLCGCSLLGLGIGALSDASSHREVPGDHVPAIEKGTEVDVYGTTSSGAERAPRILEGDFIGVEGDRLAVRADNDCNLVVTTTESTPETTTSSLGPDPQCLAERARTDAQVGIVRGHRDFATVPLSAVGKVETKSSGGWWKGLLIGLALDVAVTTFAVVSLENSHIGGPD